jgi:small subunit ribosomal protein S16
LKPEKEENSVAVRIRMKKLGRRHRAFFRVCAMDKRSPRDGRALEELGTYDPMLGDTDARAVLNGERIDYWLSVGAQPSEKVKALIKKYGTNGTHLDEQKVALATLAESRRRPELPQVKPAEETAEAPAAKAPAAEAPAAEAPAAEAPAAETPAAEAPAAEAPAAEAPAKPVEEAPAEEEKSE